uniref:CHK kinase-like domain-containing protein n=1 Tax=Heliothis virescens TaxID=7102 RepID=A0A2A4JDZ5_HELVI
MEDIPEHFKELLHKIAKEQNFVEYELDIKAISSGGANYTSRLYAVSIAERARTLRLFAKVAAIGEKMRAQAPKVYETERYCYTQLVHIYERLQEEHRVPRDQRLAFCQFYGYNPELFQETIVLADLVAAGYEPYDRFRSIDWPYAESAVTELAKIHAASMAYAKYHPDDFAKILDKVRFDWTMDDPGTKTYKETIINTAISNVNEENKGKFEKYFAELDMKAFAAAFKSSRREVLGHGDYRPSNLMHKTLDNGKLDIKIVDLQTLQGGSPLTDLLYFIFTGSDEQFRARYFDRLVEHYYSQLSAAMRRFDLNPEEVFSKEDFDNEFKEKLPYMLTLATFILPMVTVDVENAAKVDETLEIEDFGAQKTNDLYKERLNGVVNDYVKWGVLK